MHILVTRPQEHAFVLKERLQNLGHRVTLDPLIHLIPVNPEQALKSFPPSFEAIVTTSQQAIRCLPHLTTKRDFPLWCVGIESAKVAKELGFDNIQAAAGSADNLIDTLLKTLAPSPNNPILHLSGDVIRVDVAKILQDHEITAQRLIVYKSREATALSVETQHALKTGSLDAVLFYSPRTAQLFQQLCQAAKLESFCASLCAVCLSDSIKTAIAQLPWKNIKIAKKTTTDDLLIALMVAD